MRVILILFTIIFNLKSFSQSKKERIDILNNLVDSLKIELSNEQSSKLVKVSELNSNIKAMEIQISSLTSTISKLNSELQTSKTENKSKKQEISDLKSEIIKLNDSIKKIQNKQIVPFTYENPIYSENENKYFSTVLFDFINKPQILTDSLTVKFNDELVYNFYFFIPITEDFNVQCPSEFGYVVYDNRGIEIFKNLEPNGNYFGGYLEFNLGFKKRRLLGVGDSGCGSGGSITYNDLDVNNGELIETANITVSTGGYETMYFMPGTKNYIYFKRINPEAHWGGDTRYELSFYSLIDDQKIRVKETKYIYPHFGDVGVDELLKIIKKREPTIFIF